MIDFKETPISQRINLDDVNTQSDLTGKSIDYVAIQLIKAVKRLSKDLEDLKVKLNK